MTVLRALLLIALLAGCGGRGTFHPVPEDTGRAWPTQTVFLVSNHRGPLAMSRIDVALTPNREVGEVVFSGRRGFAVDQITTLEREAFLAALATEGPPDAPLRIFVHGYNNTPAEAVYRHAQMARDFEVAGPQITFAWPSIANALGYVADRDAALRSRDALERLLDLLIRSQDRDILLVGHSMGGFLVMETLRQMAIKGVAVERVVDGVILVSPDVDIDLFRMQVAAIDGLPRPFIVTISDRDRVLGLSARLAGRRSRLGSPADVSLLSDLDLLILDLSDSAGGDAGGHLQAASSPEAIAWIRALSDEVGMGP